MDEQILNVFSRLGKHDDGIEFIEYLKKLSKDNYEAFKQANPQMNDIHKGYALAIDNLIKVFETCDDKLKEGVKKTPSWI